MRYLAAYGNIAHTQVANAKKQIQAFKKMYTIFNNLHSIAKELHQSFKYFSFSKIYNITYSVLYYKNYVISVI